MPVAAGLVIGGPLSAKLTERLGIRVVVPARADDRLGRAVPAVARRRDVGLRPDRRRARAARLRHGIGDGARHRRDHGLAARGQDERRLGDQRHHAGRGRRAGRRGARLAPGQRLPWSTWTRPSARCRAAREIAQDSLAGALAVAERVGDGRLAAAAQDAFVSGMHTAALVAAARRARGRARRRRLPARARARAACPQRGEAVTAARARSPMSRGAAARAAALRRGRRGDPAAPRSSCWPTTATAR